MFFFVQISITVVSIDFLGDEVWVLVYTIPISLFVENYIYLSDVDYFLKK